MDTTTGGWMIIGGVVLHAIDLEHVGPETATLACQLPDEGWSHTDTGGHEHRWWRRTDSEDPQTPTLVKTFEHVECDGCGDWTCEGCLLPAWHCIACGEQVEPRFRPGTTTIQTTSAHWVIVTTETDEGAVVAADGTAVAASVTWPSGPGQAATMTGEAVEMDRVVECYSDGPERTLERTFRFEETT